ncbi:OmpA family protein [bacterium]|nr:OmpA family protein [bacterium]
MSLKPKGFTKTLLEAGLSRLVLSLGCGLWVLFLSSSGMAYFQDLGLGVRPVGMGEAYTAVADDSNTVLWNVAGIADLERRELNAMYSNLYSNLNAKLYTGELDLLGYHNVGMVIPFDEQIGSFGFTWSLFNTQFYKENTFVLSYARNVGPIIFKWFRAKESMKDFKLNAGMNMKILNWRVEANEFTEDNPVFINKGLSRTGFTADIGLLLATPHNLKFGLSLENFIPADVGVTVYETIPINFRLGTAYLYDWQGKIKYLDSLLGALDFTRRNGISDIRFGIEAWFFTRLLGLRTGTTVDEFTSGLSVNLPLKQSPVDLRFDYAFLYPYGIMSTWGSHRIAMIVRWGALTKPQVEKVSPPPPKIKIEPEVDLAAKREQELAGQRAQEEARLKAAMNKLKTEIQRVREELDRINELIKMGKIPSIQFMSGKTILQRTSFKSLDQVGAILEKYPQIKVRLEGHTDSVGRAKYNQRLSQQRVESVKEYLLGKFKLVSSNLIPVGYGETRPIAGNGTSAGRAANRRVEFKVLIPAGMETVKGIFGTERVPVSDGKREAKKKSGLIGGESGEKKAEKDTVKGRISQEDIVQYEDIDKLREKLKVFEMRINEDEVEQLFEQQYRENGKQ